MSYNLYELNKSILFCLLILFCSCNTKQVEVQYFDYYDTIDNIQKRISIDKILISNNNVADVYFKIEFNNRFEIKQIAYNINVQSINDIIVYKNDMLDVKNAKIVNQRILLKELINANK